MKYKEKVKGNIILEANKGSDLIFQLRTDGVIEWFVKGKKIEVKDKKLLCIALMDLVVQMSNFKYDYSLIDKKLYKDYLKFVYSKNSDI